MHRFRCLSLLVLAAAQLLPVGGCTDGSAAVAGWRALQPGVDIGLERYGPEGLYALSLLYTVVPGRSYAIERTMPSGMGQSEPEVDLRLRATRVLHLHVILVDNVGVEHAAAGTLAPGGWREMRFDGFCPALADGATVRAMRIVDRTGALGGQGPVSLKVVGLPLDR